MADKKRYQIFISSTYTDLIVERDKVMHAVLKLNCFPAGMELFPAIDRKQFDHIKSVIDECDYYLLIIGARYGSMDKKGVSYTEKEYNYAVRKGIPVIAFLHSDIQSVPLGKTDGDKELREKLEKFRNKVSKGRMVNFWKSAEELEVKVISSLVEVFEKQPRTGWVKTSSVVIEDAQREIERLKIEIEGREDEINNLETHLKSNYENLTQKDKDYNVLKSKYQAAQQEIENQKERIKFLEIDLEKLRLLLPAETFIVNEVSFKMVHVDSGIFMMGAVDDDEDATSHERPQHKVNLSDYWIGETQVTQALWLAVMDKNPSCHKEDLKCPVESVSWNDCQEFINKLNKLTGKKFHLPTEAQWEFAARGGNIGKEHLYKFAGSNDIDDVAWFIENSENNIHPVGRKNPNELGLYDMSGNVYEWCNDWFESSYSYDEENSTDPTGPETGVRRVYRGGSWILPDAGCRVSYRHAAMPTTSFAGLGLRLAL